MAKKSPVTKTGPKNPVHAMPGWAKGFLIIAAILAVLGIVFWIAVFAGIARYSGELKKAGFSFDPYQKSMRVRNPETGEEITVGEQIGIPKALVNMPIYPGSKVMLKVDSTKNPSVTLSSDTNSNKIYTWYQSELPKKGWKITESSSFLIGVENNIYKGSVALIQLDKGTTITITLDQKKSY